MLLIVVLTKILEKFIDQVKITSFHLIQLMLAVPPETEYWIQERSTLSVVRKYHHFRKRVGCLLLVWLKNYLRKC